MNFDNCIPRIALLLVLTHCTLCNADIFLEVQTSTPTAQGGLATIDVIARTDVGSVLISGFDLKFDLSPPIGIGTPVGITTASPFIANPYFTAPGSVSLMTSANADIFVNGDSGNGGPFRTLNTTSTTLFTMRFNLASDLSPGRYDVNLQDSGAFGLYDQLGIEIVLRPFVQGAIVAVPESSSWALIGFAFIGIGGRMGWMRARPWRSGR